MLLFNSTGEFNFPTDIACFFMLLYCSNYQQTVALTCYSCEFAYSNKLVDSSDEPEWCVNRYQFFKIYFYLTEIKFEFVP